MTPLVEILAYAAALDLYRRTNRREVRLTDRETSAMLKMVDWWARPAWLDSTPPNWS